MKTGSTSDDMNRKVEALLSTTTRLLSDFLLEILPTFEDNWWQVTVLDCLSYNQQRHITSSRISTLSGLDLAALLRVLDRNWYRIDTKLNLMRESRHFVKEMQYVRNRWAHAGAEGFPVDDVYRDLDTIQRFISTICQDENILETVRTTKASLLRSTSSAVEPDEPDSQGSSVNQDNTEFTLGQIVCLISNPSIRGAVTGVILGKPENRYKVFVDGGTQTYYASQLESEDQVGDDVNNLSCDQFHAYLTALQIRYPGLSTLYSLNAARVDFIPYQFRPVLRFIKSDRPRLLIADGVGVGKTIEAGLILRELQARRDVKSILIICPRPLVTEKKWQVEMKRFDEQFTHLDGKTLRYCINEMDLEAEWPEQYQKVILPYSLFDEVLLYGTEADSNRKQKKGMLDLDPPPRFDLVIVDEAHHVRNQDTYSHKAVRYFCDNAEAVLFLTATPIQLGNHDLFVLLNMLRSDLVLDEKSFEHMAEPNPHINEAVSYARTQDTDWLVQTREALDRAKATAWGQSIFANNPEFSRIRGTVTKGSITQDERVQLISDLEALHTFSGIINRTRRRDIGDFTIRKPDTVVVEFTPSQRELHDDILRVQAEIFSNLHSDMNVKFMMTTIRRQTASCLYGLAPFLEDILNRHLDELEWDEADNVTSVPDDKSIDLIRSQINEILERAQHLELTDPKLEALRVILKDKQDLSNNKVMLFSSFRHTLKYLYDNLCKEGIRVGMIHGGTPDEERVVLRDRFERPRENPDSLDLLLFSEIGCEGLDYQFCDCIVNYDLPWNPMRVEQRIGRIDRHGQNSESIAIINMITPGTVDADIYERCLLRIGVFNSALGGSEEILGEITKEIKNIAENFSLSSSEQRQKLQQLADNKIRLIQEQEELEQRQQELFGIRLPEDLMQKEIDAASSFWLSQGAVRNIVNLYLQHICGKDQEPILGEKPLKTLRLSQDARSTLLRDYHRITRQSTTQYREWENWLKGGNPHQLVTFDTACATRHPEAAFIMPLHPLVKQAAMSFDLDSRAFTALVVNANDVPSGTYEFAMYQWQFYGIREDLVLQPIASSDVITNHLNRLLERAIDVSSEISADTLKYDALDEQHYKRWSKARIEHRQRTKELAAFRKESLSTSHQARMSLLGEQLRSASDAKIRRMRQAQISAAEADYARRVQELEIAAERADIAAEPVAYGLIQIESTLR